MAMPEIHYGTGRRKTSTARVYITSGDGNIIINGKELKQYFGRAVSDMIIHQPLKCVNMENKIDVKAMVKGGGPSSQVGAVRHGLTRALMKLNIDFRPALKAAGYVTRDDRKVERKKVGLHKARKAPQYSKR